MTFKSNVQVNVNKNQGILLQMPTIAFLTEDIHKVSDYDKDIPQSHSRPTHDTMRKSHRDTYVRQL